MNYELSEKLKEAGFPQPGKGLYITDQGNKYKDRINCEICEGCYLPTLSELIKAVGFCFATLQQEHKNRTPEGYLKFLVGKP